ncbi:MAG: hypothetical protein WAU58_12745 [Terriglobales bacterium]
MVKTDSVQRKFDHVRAAKSFNPGHYVRRIPEIVTVSYLAFFTTILAKNVLWPAGDQTDVIRVGVASFPLGLFLSFAYPGDRSGAFVVVSLAAVLNAMVIFYLSRWIIRRISH